MKKKKTSPVSKKIFLSLAAAVIGIASFFAAGAVREDSRADKGFLQSRLTEKVIEVGKVWATTKVVSGVISVLETVEIQITPFGFGTAVNPLGWTAAADNVLDQLSMACLWAMGAITVEKILITLSFWAALKIALPLCALLFIVSLWACALREKIRKALVGFAVITFAACFAVPLSLGLSGLIEDGLLSGEVEKKLEAIQAGSEEAGAVLDETSGEKDFSIIDTVKNISASIVKFVADSKGVFDAYIKDAVNYLMYFLVTNILLPIATIFGLWRLARCGLNLAEKRMR